MYIRTPNSGFFLGQPVMLDCYGTDLNRNFGYHWNTGGSSDDPCAETYHGKAPNSEPEVQNVENFVMKVKDNVKFYNSLHSYSQAILLPWGYTQSEHPPNSDDMMVLANEVKLYFNIS